MKFRRRNGYTLFEVMALFLSLSVILTLAITMTRLAWNIDHNSRSQLSDQLTLHRLDQQLRHDIASARSAATLDDHQLRLTDFPDSTTVTYTLHPTSLHRQEFHGDQLVRQESYRFSAPLDIHFELSTLPQVQVRLVSVHSPARVPLPPITGLLARDLRFAKN